jgi:hypothetical protein
VTTILGRVRDAAHNIRARESGTFENTATACARLLKSTPRTPSAVPKMRFPGGAARWPQGPQAVTNAGIGPELAEFVLNAPLSSVISR